jgi:hypothetical protein
MKKRRRKRYHTGTYVSTKTGQECRYRSGWELKYMQHLDADPTVVEFLYETVVIPYVSNLRTKKVRRYYPDFFVSYADGHKVLVEIKPKRRLSQARVQKKLAAAEAFCRVHEMTLVIITEHELKGLGLL